MSLINNFFRMEFNDQTIFISKDKVSFKNGYGIVDALYPHVEQKELEDGSVIEEWINLPVVGIVDQKYHVILNLMPKFCIPKIEILPNDKLVILLKESYNYDGDDYTVCVANIKNYTTNIYDNLKSVNFDKINDTTIKITNEIEDGIYGYALYNIESEELLTPFCLSIGEFIYDERYKEKVAPVIEMVGNDQDESTLEIASFINAKGEVVSPYINLKNNKEYASNVPLDEIAETIFLENNSRVRR